MSDSILKPNWCKCKITSEDQFYNLIIFKDFDLICLNCNKELNLGRSIAYHNILLNRLTKRENEYKKDKKDKYNRFEILDL